MNLEKITILQATEKHLYEILHVLNQATINQHQNKDLRWDYPWEAEDILPTVEAKEFFVAVMDFQTIAAFRISGSQTSSAVMLKEGVFLDYVAILPELMCDELSDFITGYARDFVGLEALNFDILGYVLDFAKVLLAVDSPSGFCMEAIKLVEDEAKRLGFVTSKNAKGNLIIDIMGSGDKTVGLCAHVDTLGLMVRSIRGDGTLAFTPLGGPILPTYDGEYCNVHTRNGDVFTGTILSNQTSIHVHKEASTAARNADTMHIRLDEVVKNKADVVKLGISNGDIVAIDPKTVITPSGFVKSRFLDDKISVSCLMGILALINKKNMSFKKNIKFIISTYEEVGHGSSHIPHEIEELIAVDMGCIGDDLACTEFDVSICAKDSSGPYDYDLTSKLIDLAKAENLKYVVDIYPMYGSDVSAALRAGANIRGALIGPGVAASHGMERTHKDALDNTIKLLLAYLKAE